MAMTPPGLSLDAYVPRMAAEWELDAPRALWREMDATCCFVDISGFTALSERLARRGRIGAEELTEVLNHVFSRMLEEAYGKGGALLKFGGDALLLAFTSTDHATMAAESAVAMRAALREARTLPTSVGRVNLRMSVGIHSGIFHLFRVGASHREFLITGPAATATTRMEQTADAGEIVVSPDTAARLPRGAVGAPKGDGLLLRWRQVVEGGPGHIPARRVPDVAVESSIPVALRTRLAHGAGESEHRLASVGFVKFLGTDDLIASDGPDAAAAALDAMVRSFQQAADDESVTFLASDIDANGGKVILTTGVPATQEDDEGRLLRAARIIMEQRLPLPVRIGVNRGHVFSGDIGTSYRRTFTVMGDAVNLAARLMAAAHPGEIYATSAVLEESRTRFTTEALEPFFVKGKSEPVQAYRVGEATGRRSDSFGTLPFRGREKEVATLAQALESAKTDGGSCVIVEAERGAGKTRLVDEFKTESSARQVLWMQGEPHNSAVPYFPLRNALRRVLDIRSRDRRESGRELLAALERLDKRIVPFAPLLAVILDAEVAPTPETDAIAEEFVRQRIADIVVDTLDVATETPLLIVADDAHCFDDTTSEICQRLAGVASSRVWLIVATRRPHIEDGFTPQQAQLLSLPPLGDDVAHELAEAATEVTPLRPHERNAVVGRAGGNPLFLEELLRIVHAAEVESLPDTLDAVAMREIDALPATPRRVLRLASILGRSFERKLLIQLLESEDVDTDGDPLEELGALLVTEPTSEGIIRFRHALLQEAAYQSLPFRQRLVLHRKVGETIERESAEVEDAVPMLAFHFLAAQEWDRTWRYARLAARVARQAHALAETAVHLEHAVTAARRLDFVTGNEIAEVFGELGRALELLGDYKNAEDAYRRSSTNLTDPLRRGQMAYRRAFVRSEYLGRTTAAIRILRSAQAELRAAGPKAAGLRALLLAEEADVRIRQGRNSDAIECAGRAAVQAEQAGDKKALAQSLLILGSARVMTGDLGAAGDLERALQLLEELGDDISVGNTLNNLSALAYYAYRWDEAARYVALAAETLEKAGDLGAAAMCQCNLGEIRANQGRLDEAVELLVRARRTLESFGYRIVLGHSTLQLGRAQAFLGDVEGGLQMMQSAIAGFDEIGSHFDSLEARARLAEVLVFAERFADARTEMAAIHDLERTVGQTPLAPLVERVELLLDASSGHRVVPTPELDAYLERARDLGAIYEAMVVIAFMERLGDHRHHEELVRFMQNLGVLRLPMFPAS